MDKDFADEFYRQAKIVFHDFYIKPFTFISGGVYYVGIGSLAFKNFLIGKYGWFRTPDWKVPKDISNAGGDVIASFLKGYFDSEGNVHKRQIRVQTICPSLHDIGRLLVKLNIKNKVSLVNRRTTKGNKVYVLRICGEANLSNFKEKIGFTIQRKQKRLEHCLNGPKLQKTRWLKANRENLVNLHKAGNSYRNIADMFNLGSAMTVWKYVNKEISS